MAKPIFAVCGKGGAGKTAISALLAKAFMDHCTEPVLLIDADPAGGLVMAINEHAVMTLTQARADLISAARGSGDAEKERLADQIDYFVGQALVERDGYSLLAMGNREEKGCFCPANALLRDAIDVIAEPFALVLIDAEAGIEQINRQVTRRVNRFLVISDGSLRVRHTVTTIAEMVGAKNVAIIGNRLPSDFSLEVPEGAEILGMIPEDESLRIFDRQGKSLWDLPPENPAVIAARAIAAQLMENKPA